MSVDTEGLSYATDGFLVKSLESSPEARLDTSTLPKSKNGSIHKSDPVLRNLSEDETENSSCVENLYGNDIVDLPVPFPVDSPVLGVNSIGLSMLPNQRMLLVYKSGGKFTMMITGVPGTGKTTFINTLFGENILKLDTFKLNKLGNLVVDKQNNTKENELENDINVFRVELIEDGFNLNLTVITTPTFGKRINNQFAWFPLEKYIDEQFRLYLYQEEQPDRTKLFDSRVHCCLYFIPPNGNSLSRLDIDTMKLISERTNLIPIIAKSDTFTKAGLVKFKKIIRNTLKLEHINVCDFILDQSVSDNINKLMPFSVIGSSNELVMNVAGKKVRGRKYDWGVAETDNPEHCDFTVLRRILLSENMLDLTLSTETHYENYRRHCLNERFKEINGKEFAESLKLNGFEQLKIFHQYELPKLEMKIYDSDITYIAKEKESKVKFGQIIAVQERRFKDWKKALIEKQDHYNREIEQLHIKILKLQDELEILEGVN